ncbi:MAG: hypothetical protein AMXMBFR13_06030 [Phycisphaerae bacterium]
MKLTEKDKTFLETLKHLMEARELSVELKPGSPSHMVLRGTYGDRIHQAFKMTRQGVRWRFWRVLNDIYCSAFESILFIENTFGTQLRDHAIRISKERHELRRQVTNNGLQRADSLIARRQTGTQADNEDDSQK